MSRVRGSLGHRLGQSLLFLALFACALLLTPTWARAQDPGRVVRVGWFESPFNTTDELGRRSGYSYEYQQKIAAYTGWTYEYVEGSWPSLLQMLKDGRIDLLSDVSFTEERAQDMLFSSLPMGAEDYYLFATPDNKDVTGDDFTTFNGKKVGVNKGSIQMDYFRTWAEQNNVDAELVELTGVEEDNLDALRKKEIDLYLTLDGLDGRGRAVPLCKVGSSDFFFAVSKTRPELLPELNSAMNRIMEENPFYAKELATEYLKSAQSALYLDAHEMDWVQAHGPLRVGYQNNYLAFCSTDPQTGELTGALKDYLDVASDCLANVHLDFEPIAFPTAAAALEALRHGEIDCMFPANLTAYDGEVGGYFLTSPIMHTDMSAVIRETDAKIFAQKERVTVAVNVGNPNYDLFLLDHFPTWRSIYFADTPECLKAIAEGKADCLLISNYRYNNISSLCEQYHLTTLSTGVKMDYFFAVRRGDTTTYSILNKVANAVPDSTINAALTTYYTEDAKTSLTDTVRQNLSTAVGVFVAAVLLAVAAVFLTTRHRRKSVRTSS